MVRCCSSLFFNASVACLRSVMSLVIFIKTGGLFEFIIITFTSTETSFPFLCFTVVSKFEYPFVCKSYMRCFSFSSVLPISRSDGFITDSSALVYPSIAPADSFISRKLERFPSGKIWKMVIPSLFASNSSRYFFSLMFNSPCIINWLSL